MSARHVSTQTLEARGAGFVDDARRELLASELGHANPAGALRGLLVALALAAPFWVALYLWLRS